MGSPSAAVRRALNHPAIKLARYLKRWIKDRSRFKIGVITRQGGKSFSSSLEVVLDCQERVTTWVLLSAGERQSRELMNKAAMHARATNMAIDILESDYKAESGTVYRMLEIRFPNGSRIVGLPANPETARGWSANILLDEFAMHRDSRAIWTALFPSITRGYRIIVISTFKGKKNRFYELVYGTKTIQWFRGLNHEYVGERGGWSKHIVDIYSAVEMGLELKDDEGNPCEPEDLRLALNDDDAWQEEFCCEASDEASAWISHEMISQVEDTLLVKTPSWVPLLIEAAEANYAMLRRTGIRSELPLDVLRDVQFEGGLFLGMDIGRTKDLSVIWLDEERTSHLRTAAVIEMKNKPFFVQEQVLHTIMKHPAFRRACIDKTGIGAQLAEGAQDLFGEYWVEGLDFNPANKETLAVGLKQNFEDRGSTIPADNAVRASIHSVKKFPTTTKHFRFDAERTETTGHADHFWAKALSTHAASSYSDFGGPAEIKTVGRGRWGSQGRREAY